MNQRARRLLKDMLLAIAVTVAIVYGLHLTMATTPYAQVVSIMPLIWLALRYGVATGVVAGGISGGITCVTVGATQDSATLVLVYVLPYFTAGIAGLFAKYTQKTLNNKRYQSTYLNIGTGSLLAIIGFVVVRTAMQWLLGVTLTWDLQSAALTVMATWAVVFIGLSLVAKLNPAFLIPKRSKYLSRKETSSLLND